MYKQLLQKTGPNKIHNVQIIQNNIPWHKRGFEKIQ